MSVETVKGIEDPLDVIEDHLGRESRDVIEILLSAHATHLLDGVMAGLGIMIEGPSGCGKTTLLRSFYGLDGQIYRSDDLTPASFVSADVSRTEEELEDIDLLRRIRHKTLVVPDMGTWFAGPEDQIRKRWSTFATVIDGDGFTRDSGSHPARGYTGDYRFNFMGATTPIPPRGHRVMSHVGNRLLFVSMNGDGKTDEEAVDDLFNGPEYGEKVDTCNKAIRHYLGGIWDHYGGHGSVEWDRDPTEEVQHGITYLAKLIRYARAPIVAGEPQRENIRRPAAMLFDLARGHALLCGRETVLMDDMAVSARAALDTMPHRRRGVVRALVSPDTGDTIDTDTVMAHTGLSHPTARERMDLMGDLELGWPDDPDDNFEPKTLTIASGFTWPESLPFPDHAND